MVILIPLSVAVQGASTQLLGWREETTGIMQFLYTWAGEALLFMETMAFWWFNSFLKYLHYLTGTKDDLSKIQDLADNSILVLASSPKETSSYPWGISWLACFVALKHLHYTYPLPIGFLIVALRPLTLAPNLFTGEGPDRICTFGCH